MKRREFLLKTGVAVTAAAIVPAALALAPPPVVTEKLTADFLVTFEEEVRHLAEVSWRITDHPRYQGWLFYSWGDIDGVTYDWGEVVDYDQWSPGQPIPEKVRQLSAVAFDRTRRKHYAAA